MLRNLNLCETMGCGEIFRTYYCKRCNQYQIHYCRSCHEEHFNELDRMRNLSRLKRGIEDA